MTYRNRNELLTATLAGLFAPMAEGGDPGQAAAAETTPATTTPAITNVGKGTKARKAAAKKPSKPVAAKAIKKAAKKKPNAPQQTDRLVPADLSQYEVDKDHKTAGGNPSIHCGDPVAKLLLGKDIDQVYKIAAAKLKEPEAELRKRYKQLNPGMQRMNLGNRIRGALAS